MALLLAACSHTSHRPPAPAPTTSSTEAVAAEVRVARDSLPLVTQLRSLVASATSRSRRPPRPIVQPLADRLRALADQLPGATGDEGDRDKRLSEALSEYAGEADDISGGAIYANGKSLGEFHKRLAATEVKWDGAVRAIEKARDAHILPPGTPVPTTAPSGGPTTVPPPPR